MEKSIRSVRKVKYFSVLVTVMVVIITQLTLVYPASALSVSASPVIASLFSFSGTRPSNLGIEDGKFAPCPNTPNCVSSQSIDALHQIEPFSYSDDPETAFKQIQTILENTENAAIITAEPNYIYAEFTSPLMGFVDDVEFYLDEQETLIQVRSASRLGESDLGVNRKRIETIREQFQ